MADLDEVPWAGARWYAEGIYPRPVEAASKVKTKTLNRLELNDVTYNRMWATKAAFGVVGEEAAGCLVTGDFPIFVAETRKIEPEFMRAVFQSSAFQDIASARAVGTTERRRLKEPDFLSIQIALPSPCEQRRIVNVMGAVDAQIEALREEIARAEALWWAVARDMVEAFADSDFTRLDAIAEISGGLTKNKKDFQKSDLVEVPYLRVANVHRRYLDLRSVALIRTTRVKAEALRLQPGDILFNEGGDKDKLGRGDVWRGQIEHCIHQNHVFRARLTNPEFEPRFVSAWGNSFGKNWFEVFGTQTTGIASINKRTLSRFPIPDIPLSDQIAWADRLDAVWQTKVALSNEFDELDRFRSALLSALLNQEIEIPDSYDRVLGEVSSDGVH
ncbi:hypothetical protein [Microbacterium sp.]|uniref:restriction endonuclease subunit S n=1 Tax=Microbacterium sp. TaxID=51671 RepID=UPI0028121EE7|nr:hypothetical protein [Microbacterium sp.]